jgi:hypothetical protein
MTPQRNIRWGIPVKSIGPLASLNSKQRDGLSVAEVLKETLNKTYRESIMALITAIANDFFAACETGKGWEVCKTYCPPNATFAAQAEPLAGIKTLAEYADWMKGLMTIMPDGCACRKSNPKILVVQPAQDREAKNGPGQFDGARDRRILLQR